MLEESKNTTASVLIGPRQVGKTTVLNYLYNELCVNKNNRGIFLDLDIYSNYEKITTYENAIAAFKLAGYQHKHGRFYVFLDEFQRYKNLSIIIKNIIDHHKDIKIYATGSSSIGIKDSIQESLAGRKKINYLLPLSFSEYLVFKNKEDLLDIYNRSSLIKGEMLQKTLKEIYKYFEEFVIYGGYPEVAITNTDQDKIEVLRSIFDMYVKKELVEYLKLEKVFETKKIVQYLAINNGQKTKYQNISQLVGLSEKTVKHYIEFLKETYLVSEVRPFYKNKNKEIVKIPKIYFIDTGVVNYFINNFNNLEIRTDVSFLFETYVLAELLKQNYEPEMVKYWQNKNGYEVDFVLERAQNIYGIEIKHKETLKKSDYITLNLFKREYPVAELFLVNLSTQGVKNNIKTILPFSMNKLLFSKLK